MAQLNVLPIGVALEDEAPFGATAKFQHTNVKSLDGSELFLVRFHEEAEFVDEGSAIGTRGIQAPRCIECLLSCCNCTIYVG